MNRRVLIAAGSMILLAGVFFFLPNQPEYKSVRTSGNNISFEEDSLHFIQLLTKGQEIYALRDKLESVQKSLVYFDSALVIAERLNNLQMKAAAHFYIGNVYNAWNGQPEKTIEHYQRTFDLYKQIPRQEARDYYLKYILAHAYDKAHDTLKCTEILNEVYESLNFTPEDVKMKLGFMAEYAWISANIGNYLLSEKFLDRHVDRKSIQNDPQNNNYLDHYYITRAKIDILGKKRVRSPYTDSIELSIGEHLSNFDKQYYFNSLSNLYLASKEYKKAFETRNKEIALSEKINSGEITNLLQKNQLSKQLNDTIKENQIIDYKLKIKNLWLLISGFLILLLLVSFRLFQIQKNRKQIKKETQMKTLFTKQLFKAIEDERKRIATDLHDGIGNELGAMKHLSAAPVEQWNTKIDSIIEEIRTISRNLHPVMFDRIGLKITLEQLVERVQYHQNFMLTTEIDYTTSLGSDVELQVYRIIQEAVTNIIKHANAIAEKITITENDRIVFVEIKDNGKGFNMKDILENGKSFGLLNIIERSRAIGGQAIIKSDNSGTLITIEIFK